MSGNKKYYRRRVRPLSFIVTISLLAVCFFAGFSLQSRQATQAAEAVNCLTVVVEPGDTLWQLGKEYNPQYNGHMGKAIYQVQKANNLSDSRIYTGQVLMIPRL